MVQARGACFLDPSLQALDLRVKSCFLPWIGSTPQNTAKRRTHTMPLMPAVQPGEARLSYQASASPSLRHARLSCEKENNVRNELNFRQLGLGKEEYP